jgi:hypothetical protein
LAVSRRSNVIRLAARPLRGSWPGHAIARQTNPADAELLPEFRLFALLGTWMEEDVVEATVRNAFAQGVEAVYLVDNASTDATVERAQAAGAVLAESFRTDVYQEDLRILLMNAVVARVSLDSGAAHVWWLWLDADEFPEGPEGTAIAEYLRTLDRRFRLVGSTYYNHFPTEKPEYLPGFHPVDFQPMCERFVRDPRPCSQEHFKHPLQRFDRAGPFLMSLIGFHSANTLANRSLLEPEGGIVTHHVQYREEAATRARMQLVAGDRAVTPTTVSQHKRFESLDAVYGGRWQDVDNLRTRGPSRGVHPRPWSDPGAARRWYAPDDLDTARSRWLAGDRTDHDR